MKKRRIPGLIVLFLLTNFVFVLLYRRFLIGDGVYMYLDIGSDSMSSSYPIIVLLGRLFRSGDFSSYSLEFGLGNDITGTFLQYLNPVKFILLLFDEDTLPVGIMLMVFLVTNLISLFSWLYFRMILKRDDAAFFPALMWTFSGYITLWSQNLSFGCAMMMVTLTMLILEHCLETPTMTWYLALTGEVALFLITNYYFLYITAVFAALYMILRGILLRTNFVAFLKSFASVVLSVIGSLFPAMIAIIPILGSFTGSSRSSGVASGSALHVAFLDRLDLKRALTILARIFSPNTIGLGDSYTGSVNYYEAALISTSILALFAGFYLLFKKESRWRTLLVLAVGCIMLAIPFTGQIMNMNVLSYRYSFVICFAECIAAGFFARDLLEDPDRKALAISMLLAVLFTGGILLLIKTIGKSAELTAESRTLKEILLTLGIWLLFFAFTLPTSCRTKNRRRRTIFLPLSLFILCCELILMNNDSLYLRSYVTKDMFQNSMYHTGVREAAAALDKTDSSLYRSVADATFNFANQGAVDNYASTTAYFNTNPSSMWSYDLESGMFQYSQNFFLSDVSQYPQFTLLSGKYLMKSRSNLLDLMIEPSLFQTVRDEPDEQRVIFENSNALPFGYLYQDQMKHSTFSELALPEKLYAETQAYFETNETEETEESGKAYLDPSETKKITGNDLNPLITETNSVTVSAETEVGSGDILTTMTKTGDDPWVICQFDTSKDTDQTVRFLYLKLKDLPQTGNTFLFPVYYLSEEYPEADKVFSSELRMTALFPELCIMLPEGVTGIRLGIPVDQDEIVLRNFEVITTDSLSSDYSKLKSASKAVRDISYNEKTDTYTAFVTTDQDSMLCVPVFFTKNWSASVNGVLTEIHNINGGLIGIPVKSGTNRIVLQYSVPHLKAGLIVSILSLIVYIAAWIRRFFHEKSSRHRSNIDDRKCDHPKLSSTLH